MLPRPIESILNEFIPGTIQAWMNALLIQRNNYGVVILVGRAGGDFTDAAGHRFGATDPKGKHDVRWYQQNAEGKIQACLATGLDSHEAVRLYQGALIRTGDVFPWGGAIIDKAYGLAVGVSGGKEDEDILLARTIRNFTVMHLDRLGQARLDDARQRGEQEGRAGADRFTR